MAHELDGQGRPIRRGKYPELTLPAVLVGYVLGAIIALSIGYASLILGFSIEGSELAAILGWGILRGIMKRTSIIENNINQTIASAVNGASAGMMFSVPALFILARENPEKYGGLTEFNPVLMVLACITGGILGLAFIIPLRKQMIDFNRLAYPGGIAVAAILKSPGAGMKKAALLLTGATISGVFFLIMLYFKGGHPDEAVGQHLGLPSFLNITFFLSLMTVGVGFLSGRGGLVFGYGGFICYFLLAPLLGYFGNDNVKNDILDPPVRSALLTTSDIDDIEDIAEDLKIHDEAAGAALITLVKPESEAAEDVKPNGVTVFNDVAQARAILASADVIEKLANSLPDEASPEEMKAVGFQSAEEAKHAADRLRSISRAKDVIAAADALASSDLRSELASQSTAKGVMTAIQTSDAPEESQQTLLKATRAEEIYYDVPDGLRLGLFRPTGIGVLIGAAIGGIIAAFPLVRSAIKSMQQAAAEKKNNPNVVSDEMPIKVLYGGVIGGAAALAFITMLTVENMGIGRGIAMAGLGTLWIWIAGVIVSECLGRTNWSPLSGMTLIAVTILLFIASGLANDTSAIISSVICGAAICVAIAQAGDMMLDLKSGYLVGALPKWQQTGQVLGTWLGPIVIIMLIFALHDTYGLGSENLPAPQGAALASMINGVVGGDVPTWRYTAGAGLGLILAFSGLGGVGVQIGLGFYMPFDIVLTYTIGCLTRMYFQKKKGMKFIEDVGIPLAAGLIVGEALVGVGNAFVQIIAGG